MKLAFIQIISIFFYSSLVIALPSTGIPSHFYDEFISSQQQQALNTRVKQSPVQPYAGHPRLFGSNQEWYKNVQTYESLDPNCDWQGESNKGTVKNIKSEWDRYSLGGELCKAGTSLAVPSSLNNHSIASDYLNDTIDKWRRENALKIIHLIRRMNHCLTLNQTCFYNKQEIDQLSTAFLRYEFDRIKNSPRNSAGFIAAWHKGYQGKFFDLGAYPAFKLWTLIIDTFWNTTLIASNDRQFILDELESEIDSYIATYNLPASAGGNLGRWALRNGNNWNPVLNAAALFWAITFWNEDPYTQKAKDVLDIVLESSWLHRDFILDDGAYVEGPSYLDVSLSGAVEINNLLMASFGEPNHAIKWGVMENKTTNWMLENIASDGKFIDFGDAWAREGYNNFYFIDLLYWKEMTGLKESGTVVADSCKLQRYFSTSYYLHTFYDPWKASPHYARNFYPLIYPCQSSQPNSTLVLFPEYKLSTLRQYIPGATQTAANVDSIRVRNKQADQTFLAANGVSNTIAHREIDFGALIWSAFGNRLLADWGYGEISKSYEFYKITGSKGHYIAGNDHTLEFYLKHINGELKINRLFISLKLRGKTKQLPLSDYISTLDIQTWSKVSIPLSDFSLTENEWLGKGDGIEAIRLKTTGFITNGEFGLDEISIRDSQGNIGIKWYGDDHGESLESSHLAKISPQINVPTQLELRKIENQGGALGTNKWSRFYATEKYSIATIFYDQNAENLNVANYMDFLPIGANTLIIPNAIDTNSVSPKSTNTSQFKGQTGAIKAIKVDGRDVIHMDASAVYGKDLSEGNLDYFYRYLLPINDGNFVVIDAFKAKPGKHDYIQEFWYSYKDKQEKSCSEKSNNVVQSKSDRGDLLLTPQCNTLENNGLVEAFGRITAASLQPGSFILGAPEFMRNNVFFNRFVEGNGLYLINRLNQKEMRNLARFSPDNKVSEDVRIFLLQSSTSSSFNEASIKRVSCHYDLCFNVEVENSDELTLGFNKKDEEYILENTTFIVEDMTEKTDVNGPRDNKNQSGAGTFSLLFLVFLSLITILRANVSQENTN